jgi:ATP-dependent Lon protease
LPGKGPGTETIEIAGEIPVLPLRNSVLFPGSIRPIQIDSQNDLVAAERARPPGTFIAIVAQLDAGEDGPDLRLHEIGCAARIHKSIKMGKQMVTVIVQGLQRIRVLSVDRTGPCFVARVEAIPEPGGLDDALLLRKTEALKESALLLIAAMPELPKETHALVSSIKHPGQLADALASQLEGPAVDKQKVLETIPLAARVELVLEQVNQERARRA